MHCVPIDWFATYYCDYLTALLALSIYLSAERGHNRPVLALSDGDIAPDF